MVSPIYKDAFNENVACFIEVHNNIVMKISSAFCKEYGYDEKDLLNQDIFVFFKDTLETIEDDGQIFSRDFFKATFKTKYGIKKTSLVMNISVDIQKNIIVFKNDIELLQFYFNEPKTDKLTGFNLKHTFNKEKKKNNKYCAVYFEIINLFQISGYFGEDFADTLIVSICNKLKKDFNSKFLYKIDNGTFCILKNQKYGNIKDFKNDIIEKLSQFDYEYSRNGKKSILKVDFTLAFAEGNGNDIFYNCSTALSYCKDNNLKSYIYDEIEHFKMKDLFFEEKEMLIKLKEAIKNNRIISFYQPIFCNNTNRITKYECLARLKEENGDILPPSFFLDIARKYNLNNEIAKCIIRESFNYFKNIDVDFSINLTYQTIKDLDMFYFILDAVDSFPRPCNIIFEVIESEAMPLELFEKDALVKELRARGCKFALDDFGTGYSNLSMLTYFNYNYLKIDGSLIVNIQNKASYKTIKTIVELAHNHDVKVVAEWVKDENIQNIVKELKIDYSQGFFFGKPEAKIIHDKAKELDCY